MSSSFFAFVNRTKYINRWGLMRSSYPENVCEHSMQTAILAHALAVAARDIFGCEVNPEEIAVAALYHDCSEILTGDMPTPVKYRNEELRNAYKETEKESKDKLYSTLPEPLKKGFYDSFYFEENKPDLYLYIKAADRMSAYLKCLEETASGNPEFVAAEKSIKESIDKIAENMPALKWFMDEILPTYSRTLDDL